MLHSYQIESFEHESLKTADGWWNTALCFRPSGNETADAADIAKHAKLDGDNATRTPVEEFWM